MLFVVAFLFLLPCVLGEAEPEDRKGKSIKCPKVVACGKKQVNCGAPPIPADVPKALRCKMSPLCLDAPLTKKNCPKWEGHKKAKGKKGKGKKKAAKKAKKAAKKSG